MCPVCVQRSNGTSCQWEWYEVLDKENGGTRFKESNLRNVVHVQMAGTVHQVRVGWAMVETLSEIRQIFKVHNDHNMTIRGFPPKTVKVRCAKGSFNMMRNMRIAKKFRIIRCGRVRGIRYTVLFRTSEGAMEALGVVRGRERSRIGWDMAKERRAQGREGGYRAAEMDNVQKRCEKPNESQIKASKESKRSSNARN